MRGTRAERHSKGLIFYLIRPCQERPSPSECIPRGKTTIGQTQKVGTPLLGASSSVQKKLKRWSRSFYREGPKEGEGSVITERKGERELWGFRKRSSTTSTEGGNRSSEVVLSIVGHRGEGRLKNSKNNNMTQKKWCVKKRNASYPERTGNKK